MVVLIVEAAPASLRGELSRWMLEPKAGVFVGNVSATVRDLLWEKACREVSDGGATLLYNTSSEQGYAMRSFGDASRQVEEWEGLFLVRRPALNDNGQDSGQQASSAEPVDWQSMCHPAVWAKTARGVTLAPGEADWHPLYCHMVDVAMVCLRLWRYVLPPVVTERMRAALGVGTVAEAGRWIAYFAGLHDLGKAYPGFALSWESGRNRLLDLGLRPSRIQEPSPHGFVSTHLLEEMLPAQGFGRKTAAGLGFAVGGHHGQFPSPAQVEAVQGKVGGTRWREVRQDLLRLLAHALGVDTNTPPAGAVHDDNAFLVMMAGLTSVADWIGSNHRYFPFVGNDVDWLGYVRRARWLALRALIDLGWLNRPQVAERRRFGELFPFAPNALQQAVAEVAEQLKGPSLVIVEAPMGGGKTEAALFLADHFQAVAGQRGMYFALPTMATSNQMFDRVTAFLANRYPAEALDVHLLHGRADLNPHYGRLLARGAGEADPPVIEEPTQPGLRLKAAEWFTYGKQGLLAPFGIGTIDQALLAALEARHYFVRLFGLAGKIVVVDEVHSYDVYMGSLLERLLSWLAACGTSVILLSATLPARRRRDLLAAYATGRGVQVPADGPDVSYPRISWLAAGEAHTRPIEAPPARRVAVRTFASGQGAWIAPVRRVVSDGGCVAIVCNTVVRAQETYQSLRERFAPEELLLFHARYPFDDRMQREEAVLRLFGKGSAQRPRGMVCVATQVIEQSLDIDFDLLVTDLAPVDLVLQRLGRVWRHPGAPRPAALSGPECWILMPPPTPDGVPLLSRSDTAVYNTHVLLRSYLALKDRAEIAIPADLDDLIELVYGEGEPPADSADAIADRWRATAEDRSDREERQEQMARRRAIPSLDFSLPDRRPLGLDEEDEEVHEALMALTRLGGPSVEIVCLYERASRLYLTSDDQAPISFDVRPNREAVRSLLGRSMRIGFDASMVRTIRELPVPPTWQVVPHLRRYRPLRFSPEGLCLEEGIPLRIDPILGLTKSDGEAGER